MADLSPPITNERCYNGHGLMTKSILFSLLTVLTTACEPEASDDPEPPPGTLEFEHTYARIYRDDRRVHAVLVEGNVERRECGMLSDRAYAELTDALSPLEPGEDYGYDPARDDCSTPPGAYVHVEGLQHSPFRCDFQCCRPELVRVAVVYMLVESWFSDREILSFDGEPYVAIEPDQPCP